MGPGLVHLIIHHWLMGDAILVHTITPIEPLKQKLTHCCWSRTFPRFAAKLILFSECLQVGPSDEVAHRRALSSI